MTGPIASQGRPEEEPPPRLVLGSINIGGGETVAGALHAIDRAIAKMPHGVAVSLAYDLIATPEQIRDGRARAAAEELLQYLDQRHPQLVARAVGIAADESRGPLRGIMYARTLSLADLDDTTFIVESIGQAPSLKPALLSLEFPGLRKGPSNTTWQGTGIYDHLTTTWLLKVPDVGQLLLFRDRQFGNPYAEGLKHLDTAGFADREIPPAPLLPDVPADMERFGIMGGGRSRPMTGDLRSISTGWCLALDWVTIRSPWEALLHVLQRGGVDTPALLCDFILPFIYIARMYPYYLRMSGEDNTPARWMNLLDRSQAALLPLIRGLYARWLRSSGSLAEYTRTVVAVGKTRLTPQAGDEHAVTALGSLLGPAALTVLDHAERPEHGVVTLLDRASALLWDRSTEVPDLPGKLLRGLLPIACWQPEPPGPAMPAHRIPATPEGLVQVWSRWRSLGTQGFAGESRSDSSVFRMRTLLPDLLELSEGDPESCVLPGVAASHGEVVWGWIVPLAHPEYGPGGLQPVDSTWVVVRRLDGQAISPSLLLAQFLQDLPSMRWTAGQDHIEISTMLLVDFPARWQGIVGRGAHTEIAFAYCASRGGHDSPAIDALASLEDLLSDYGYTPPAILWVILAAAEHALRARGEAERVATAVSMYAGIASTVTMSLEAARAKEDDAARLARASRPQGKTPHQLAMDLLAYWQDTLLQPTSSSPEVEALLRELFDAQQRGPVVPQERAEILQRLLAYAPQGADAAPFVQEADRLNELTRDVSVSVLARAVLEAGAMLWDPLWIAASALRRARAPLPLRLTELAAAHMLSREKPGFVVSGAQVQIGKHMRTPGSIWPCLVAMIAHGMPAETLHALYPGDVIDDQGLEGELPLRSQIISVIDDGTRGVLADEEAHAVFSPYGLFRVPVLPRVVYLYQAGVRELIAAVSHQGIWARVLGEKQRPLTLLWWEPRKGVAPLLGPGYSACFNLLLAALWRDCRVAGEQAVPVARVTNPAAVREARAKARDQARASGDAPPPGPAAAPASHQPPPRVLPRALSLTGMRDWELPEEWKQTPEPKSRKHGRGKGKRGPHFVTGHPRRLPDHWNPDTHAKEKALEYGVILPEGHYTWIPPHARGIRGQEAEGIVPKPILVKAKGLVTVIVIMENADKIAAGESNDSSA